MIEKQVRTPRCPRCDIGLVHGFDLTSDVGPAAGSLEQRWLCPRCGLSRPVVYSLGRQTAARGLGRRGLVSLLLRRPQRPATEPAAVGRHG